MTESKRPVNKYTISFDIVVHGDIPMDDVLESVNPRAEICGAGVEYQYAYRIDSVDGSGRIAELESEGIE